MTACEECERRRATRHVGGRRLCARCEEIVAAARKEAFGR